MKRFIAGVALLIVALCGSSGLAHHSFAMFDATKTVAIEGTVREFTWTNPHATLWVVSKDAAGATKEWPIEMTGPAALTRMGLTKRSFNAGDRIKADIHPLRNGSIGGSLVGATFLATGQYLRLNREASALPPRS